MAWDKTSWEPPLVELAGCMAGLLLAWERHERDGCWWAWVSWIHESDGRRDHKVVWFEPAACARWNRPRLTRQFRGFRPDPWRPGQSVVQHTSTATSSTVSDIIRLRPIA